VDSKLLVLLTFFLSFMALGAENSDIIQVSRQKPLLEELIGRKIYLFNDHADDADPESILRGELDAKFVRSDRDFPNQGLSATETWVRFTIHNESSEAMKLYLESRYSFIDYLTIFQKNAQGAYEGLTQGDQLDYAQRPIKFRLPVYELHIPPGTHTYYGRIKTKGTLIVSFFLWDPASFQDYKDRDMLILGLCYGAVLILIIYNIFLAASFRSKTYSYYCVYLLLYLFTQFGVQSTGLMWLPGAFGKWSMNLGFLIMISVTQVISCLFAYYFLNVPQFMKRWKWPLFLVIAFNCVNMTIGFLGDYNMTARITSFGTLVTSVILIMMGIRAAFRGFRPAIYFSLGWTAVLSGNVLLALLFNGLFPMNLLVQWGNFIGGVIEAALMSLALADRINYLQAKSESTIKHLNNELTRHIQEVEGIVEERTETIRSIVDNVKSGFLTINRNLLIEPGFTRSCYSLVSKDIHASLSILDILHLQPHDRELFKMAVQQVFDDLLGEDAALSQIPKLHRIGSRVLNLEGSVIRDQNNAVKSVLFTITDVTRLKRKQKEANRSSMLLKILRNMEAFRAFLAHTQTGLKQLRRPDADRQKINFVLHTMKGNSLMFNLKPQANLLHRLEEKNPLSPSDIDQIEKSFRDFLQKHHDVLNLSWDETNAETYLLRKEAFQDLQDRIHNQFKNAKFNEELDRWIQWVCLKSVKSLLGPLEDDMQQLAKTLQKKLRLKVEGTEVRVVTEAEKELVKTVFHLVRNSLIHGIEERRAESGKDPVGSIRLQFVASEDAFRICLEDDGAGFDLATLRQRAVDQGLMDAASADRADLTQILEKLAGVGFSTKVSADLFSGRGVGIGAVFEIIRKQRGSIQITSESGKGTRIFLETPRASQFLDIKPYAS
jgi:signal transduction histidine kinase